jgi:hypothetical protein
VEGSGIDVGNGGERIVVEGDKNLMLTVHDKIVLSIQSNG